MSYRSLWRWGIVFLHMAVKGFNAWVNICCKKPYNPSHCNGYQHVDVVDGFSIPRGRGNAYYDNIMDRIFYFAFASPPPIIIITTMVMMYKTVLYIEKNLERYGVSTLRLHFEQKNNRERVENDLNEDRTSNGMVRNIFEKIQCYFISRWSYHSLRNLLSCQRKHGNTADHEDTVVRRRG